MGLGKLAQPLSSELKPVTFACDLPSAAVGVLEAAQAELEQRAAQDSNGCFGYFPALQGKDGIASDLPHCQAFAEAVPSLNHLGGTAIFNFLRLSNRQQSTQPVYHLDTDAATALTGDVETLDERLVCRTLLNLSPDYTRAFTYLDIDPREAELQTTNSYVGLKNPGLYGAHALSVVLQPREGTYVEGVSFFSNRVLHSGQDDKNGHFVAGYGYEVAI